MSEPVSLEWIGVTLRAIQAEQRTLRMENELLRAGLARVATREELGEVLRVLAERIGNFEALIEARLDMLSGQMTAIAARLA